MKSKLKAKANQLIIDPEQNQDETGKIIVSDENRMGTLFIRSVLLIFVVPIMLIGQMNNFNFVQYDTNTVSSEDFIVLHGDIFNLIDSTYEITVTRVTHVKPDAWSTSFCVGPACLPPFLDTFTFSLAAGDTALFSLDTYHNSEMGVGSWTMYAVDSSSMEIDSVQITLEVVTVSIDENIEAPESFDLSYIFPNPTNAWISFDLDVEKSAQYTLVLYSLTGRELISRSYRLRSGKNQLHWAMGTLPSGNYILSATNDLGQTISRQVSVVK